MVTVEVAGEHLGLSRRAAHRAAGAGDLPTVTLSGKRRVPTAELYRLLGLPIPERPVSPAIGYSA